MWRPGLGLGVNWGTCQTGSQGGRCPAVQRLLVSVGQMHLPKRTLTLFHESEQINFTLYGLVELKEF